MKIFLVLSLVFVGIWAKPSHGESSGIPAPSIMNDPPRPPTPRPRRESPVMNTHQRPPVPKHTRPEFLPRTSTENGIPLFQGDLVLTQEQMDYFYGPINTRKAIDDITLRWTDGIVPYAISQESEPDRDAILSGIQHWMDNSCLIFTEVEEDAAMPHLIFWPLDGCWSEVGMQPKDGQDVSIGEGCNSTGTVAHEIGHALGFYHEQSRTDRDKHVKLLDHNINQTMKFNFDIQYDTNNYGLPYDLRSLMHYGLDDFTVNGGNTMIPLDIHKTFEIGQRDSLSFYDLKLAHIIYNCAANCASKPSCQNQGYVDSNCRCQCPAGFSGNLCQNRVQLPGPICGGDLTRPTTISTPNYPGKYSEGNTCIWTVEAPAGKRVKVSFTSFDLIYREQDTGYCLWDFLEVRARSMDEGNKYCETELDSISITSTGNQMALLFRAQYDWNTGFKADITFV